MKIDKAAQSAEQQQATRERDASARCVARAAQPAKQQAVRMPLPGEGLAPVKLGSKPCTLQMRWRGWWYTHWVPCHIGAHTAMHSAFSMRKSAPLCVAAVARCLG